MTALDEIPILIQAAATRPTDTFGNALPILSEIRHAIQRLVETGEPTCIDLAAMPFGPGDEERLMHLLGRGEVEATIDALGPTRIRETAFAGVWIIDYANTDDQRIALQIEIDEVPRILRSQRDDLTESLAALTARLDAESPGPMAS